MVSSAVTRFTVLFAVIMVVGYVAASPVPEPEPQPEPSKCCCCGCNCGASETKCGAVVVPTCVTIHHRCGTIRKCCPCCCCC